LNPSGRRARVARLPYLNTAPFYLRWGQLTALSEGRWESVVLTPRQLGMAAEAGEVDAGVMAVADLIRLEDSFERLLVPSSGAPVSFGIANRDRVDSVLLFLRGPDRAAGEASEPERIPDAARPLSGSGRVLRPEEAARLDGAVIGITGETSTSFRLLRLLLETRHKVRPRAYQRMDLGRFARAETDGPMTAANGDSDPFPPAAARGAESAGEPITGALVIGDTALRWRHRPPRGFSLAMDLASAWFAWTGLPFVFACWGVRRSLPDSAKEWLGRFLEDSLDAAEGRREELVRDLPSDLGPCDVLAEYLRNFTYRLGPDELRAIALFRQRLEESGIACTS
jgi:predicted solute-binding protein